MAASEAQAADVLDHGWASPHTLASTLTRGNAEPYRLFPHVCFLGRIIADAVCTPDSRLIVNLGPRTGKSTLISEWSPAWFLTLNPTKRVLLATNTSPLAKFYGGRVRDILNGNPDLGITLKDDTVAKDEWATTKGGGMKTVGVSESVMGRGGNLLIIDDPYASWSDGQSSTVRRSVYDWFRATASSRLEPGASVIVLHHRMHTQDLTGQLLAGEDGHRWKHVSLPSLAGQNDPMGRKPGEAICPERYTAAQLEAMRVQMGPAFDALHQQNPHLITAGGAYSRFSPENIDHTVTIRPDLPLQLSVDFNIVPGMHVYLGQHDPIADVITVTHEVHKPNMNLMGAMAEIERIVSALPSKPSQVEVYGDSSGSARSISTGITQYQIVIQALERMGINAVMRVPRANPKVTDRLTTFNYALRDADGADGHGKVRYRINPRCTRLIRDLTAVQCNADGSLDKSDPDLTHGSDAEGYRVWRLRGMRIELPTGRYGV
jgi:hypothetical protein